MNGWERLRLRTAQIPPLAWAAMMLGAVIALGGAATMIDAVARADAAVVRELHGEVALRDVEEHVFAVTDLAGSPMLLVGVTAVVTLLLVRRWRAALALILAVALTKLTVAVVKDAVERSRPDTGSQSYDTFSFPSGHAASAAALYMTLAVLLAHGHGRAVRALVLCTGALLTIAVGLTRVLLGAHFPTDVAAGWLVGGLLALCAWAVVIRLAGHPPQPDESTGERLAHVLSSPHAPLPPRVPDDANI